MARTLRNIDPGYAAGSRYRCRPVVREAVDKHVAKLARDKTGRKWPVLEPFGIDEIWGPGAKKSRRRTLHRADRRAAKSFIREEI
jgi:hypothetical protein